jgi:hypothetical protein
MINRKTFFDKVRLAPFPGALQPSQVSGMEAILSEWERRGLTDLRWLAYMLATAYHETAHTMQPIAEYGRGKGRKYGIPVNGKTYYGRGYVQLTWDYNYKKMGDLLNVDLVNNQKCAGPEGCRRHHVRRHDPGLVHGKKLSDYFSQSSTDFINARKIINGLDRAELIAGHARQFHGALGVAMEAKPAPAKVPAAKAPATSAGKVGGILAAIGAGIWAIVTFINDHPVLVFLGIAAAIAGGVVWNFWRKRQP